MIDEVVERVIRYFRGTAFSGPRPGSRVSSRTVYHLGIVVVQKRQFVSPQSPYPPHSKDETHFTSFRR